MTVFNSQFGKSCNWKTKERLVMMFSKYSKLIVLSIVIAFFSGITLVGKNLPTKVNDSSNLAQRLDKWRVLGPGGGGAQYYPTISPHNPNRILINCDMTGSYISNDGGESWRMFNLRGAISFFVFDPINPEVIYAKTIGLWRSVDSGRTWQLIHPFPENIKEISMANDHAAERIITKDGSTDSITALAIDPADSKILYATISSSKGAMLKVSNDYGVSWKDLGMLSDNGKKIFVDMRSPVNDRVIYVVLKNSISVLKGSKWTHLAAPESVAAFSDVSGGFLPESGKLVVYGVIELGRRFASVDSGVYVTVDGGETWEKIKINLENSSNAVKPSRPARFFAVAACATQPNITYLSYSNFNSKDPKKPFNGIAKTINCGKTWELLQRRHEGPVNWDPTAPKEDPAWFYSLYSGVWEDEAITLGVSPHNPDVCYATDLGNTVRSFDGGKTWKTCCFKIMPQASSKRGNINHIGIFRIRNNPMTPLKIKTFKSIPGFTTII